MIRLAIKKTAAINSGFFITKKCKKNQLEQAYATKLSYTLIRVWIKTVRFSLLQNHNPDHKTPPTSLTDHHSSQTPHTTPISTPYKSSASQKTLSTDCFVRLNTLSKENFMFITGVILYGKNIRS